MDTPDKDTPSVVHQDVKDAAYKDVTVITLAVAFFGTGGSTIVAGAGAFHDSDTGSALLLIGLGATLLASLLAGAVSYGRKINALPKGPGT